MAGIITLAGLSFYENKSKRVNNESLALKCQDSRVDIEVLLLVDSANGYNDNGHSTNIATETLFSIIQNASCPKSLKVTIVQSVMSYEKESRLLKSYKDMCAYKGRFSSHFLELVELHQVFNSNLFFEAQNIVSSERKLLLVVDCQSTSHTTSSPGGSPGESPGESRGPKFLLDWDTYLNYDELKGPAFGGLYCGAGLSQDGVPRPSFTSLINNTIESWPLWRSGPPVQSIWPASPVLIENQSFKKMQGQSLQEALMNMPGRFWTTRNPIALVNRFVSRVQSGRFHSGPGPATPQALGVSENANHLEIIMKYGSISGYNWSMTSQ